MEQPQEAPAPRKLQFSELLNPHPDCLAEITQEAPFYQELYDRQRDEQWPASAIDRRPWQVRLLKEAELSYQIQTGEKLAHWQRRMMARFTRNLAVMESQLVAGLYDLTVAARSIVDDNFAWEVWRAANSYSWQQTHCQLETINLSANEVFLHSRRCGCAAACRAGSSG